MRIISLLEIDYAKFDLVKEEIAQLVAQFRDETGLDPDVLKLSVAKWSHLTPAPTTGRPYFRDLGERNETGGLRTADERWPDGSPT
jgi:hypothetical protein